MKLETSLQLGALVPFLFAMIVVLLLFGVFGVSLGGTGLIVMAAIGLLGLVMSGVMLMFTRRIVTSVRALNGWIGQLMQGNLDAQIDTSSVNDEVGRLAKVVGGFLDEVKKSYVAAGEEVSEQRRQALEFKQRAMESQASSKYLSVALDRMKVIHEDDIRKERIAVLGRVAPGIIHDLSQALVPMLGVSELMLAHPEQLKNQERVTECLKAVQASSEQARRSLVDLARLFQRTAEDLTAVDVKQVVDRALTRTEAWWKKPQATKSISVRTALEPVSAVAGVEGELEDSLVHLIVNAVEAVNDGGVITVSVRQIGGTSVCLSVRDTGRGMKEEVRLHCLEPFFTTKETVGAGKGLAIVNATVSRHHGKLQVESAIGKGTLVSLTLPVWAPKAEERTVDVAVKGEAPQAVRVIVIDDDLWSRRIVASILGANGYVVEPAEGGNEGLRKVAEGEYDVAIVDQDMPDLTGDKVIASIRSTHPHMAIVLMTGFGEYMVAQGIVPGGVDAMLPKPATETDVQRAVSKALSVAKARSAPPVVADDAFVVKPLISPKKAGAPPSGGARKKPEGGGGGQFEWIG